jgi:hypothetical protein
VECRLGNRVSVYAIERACSSAFSLSTDRPFMCFHLLPPLLGDSSHGVVADSECASDCPLGVTWGESVSRKTLAAITVLGSPRNRIAVNNSTDIGFNTNQQPKEIICENQK